MDDFSDLELQALQEIVQGALNDEGDLAAHLSDSNFEIPSISSDATGGEMTSSTNAAAFEIPSNAGIVDPFLEMIASGAHQQLVGGVLLPNPFAV